MIAVVDVAKNALINPVAMNIAGTINLKRIMRYVLLAFV